jgi:ubiquinone/menaquinone biosynthesis C-methylase UbiE
MNSIKSPAMGCKPVRVERALAVADGIKAGITLTPQMTALEYGCGTGLLSFALQPYLGHITLADSSPGMLSVLREKIAAGSIQNTCTAHNRLRCSAGVTPMQLDVTTDPLPSERYPLIYTLMTLHHIPDTDKTLQAFYTLLGRPGYLCVADLDKEDGSFHQDEFHGHLGFDRDELSAKARQAGFQAIRFTTVFHMIKDIRASPKIFRSF